ncbi:SLATT domain-containing protein [Bacillus sp. 22446]|uniref:SLATT domain-containing protein n=1 Tax=Bacillus TaxID=1386 RepID=UPI0025406377|nr:SLATT domain-containing protein [Bacillus altitudinis]MED0681608.1 SLATT domain-containing protein [Bacillus altitudinis]
MIENIKEDIESLKDNRIWITKKARMEAEARLNRNNLFAQLLVNYYTFVVLAFSIWTLVSQDKVMSLLTVIASVGLFGVSIFVSSAGFREKALQFKDSYSNLNELEFELNNLLRISDSIGIYELIKRLKEYEIQYNNILNKIDNHKDVDYIKVRLKHQSNITFGPIAYYYFNKFVYYTFILLLLIIPFVLSIIYLIMNL